MGKVTALYTGPALLQPVKSYFQKKFPGHEIVNVLDDGIVAELIKDGKMGDALIRRIYAYCKEAYDAGSDVILQTCSSVGRTVPLLQPLFPIPILRIDAPMASMVVDKYERVAVLATLASTLEPTMELVRETALAAGRTVGIENGLADGAFQALSAGDGEAHDRLILETAEKLKVRCDAFLLAQGSMARMKDGLEKATGKPVLASPESGVDALAPYLERMD